jgi:chromosome segregation ATPase
MGGEFDTILVGLASGGGGAAAVAPVVWLIMRAWVQAQFAELERLRKADEASKLARMASIEERMSALEDGCVAKHEALAEQRVEFARLLEEVKNLVGWTKRMDMRLERLLEDVPALKTDLAGKGLWLGNLNEAMRQHMQDRGSHGGE